MFAPYWTTKQTLANMLVQLGCVNHQTPKSKLIGPRVHFPYRGIAIGFFYFVLTINLEWGIAIGILTFAF
jgi:hypothetical protein